MLECGKRTCCKASSFFLVEKLLNFKYNTYNRQANLSGQTIWQLNLSRSCLLSITEMSLSKYLSRKELIDDIREAVSANIPVTETLYFPLNAELKVPYPL